MSNQDSKSAGSDGGGVTRRGLLRGAASVGAAGLAVGLAAGSGLPAAAATTMNAATTHQPAVAPSNADQPVVAHVRDATTGAIDLYVGTRHIALTDPQLAARLTNAAR
jgi:hypothetical protein